MHATALANADFTYGMLALLLGAGALLLARFLPLAITREDVNYDAGLDPLRAYLTAQASSVHDALFGPWQSDDAWLALASGVTLWGCWHAFGATPEALLFGYFALAQLVIIRVCYRYLLIPDWVTYSLGAVGLAASTYGLIVSPHEAIWGLLVGGSTTFLLREMYMYWRQREAFGLGVVCQSAAIGAWFGWQRTLACLGIAAVLTTVIATWLHARRASPSSLPFGDKVALVALVALFCCSGN